MYTIVNPINVEHHWPLAAPWIAQAIGASDTWMDLDYIKQQCKEGVSNLWIGRDQAEEIEVVLVTETWFIAGRKTCVMRWLAGRNMDAWFQDFATLENFAFHNGFQAIHIWGRKGWERACKSLGFTHEFTVLGKPIIRGLQ